MGALVSSTDGKSTTWCSSEEAAEIAKQEDENAGDSAEQQVGSVTTPRFDSPLPQGRDSELAEITVDGVDDVQKVQLRQELGAPAVAAGGASTGIDLEGISKQPLCKIQDDVVKSWESPGSPGDQGRIQDTDPNAGAINENSSTDLNFDARVRKIHSSVSSHLDECTPLSREELKSKEWHRRHLIETAPSEYVDGEYRFRSVWNTTQETIGSYGVGVQLFFELYIVLGVLFLILFIIQCPLLVMCMTGSIVSEDAATRDQLVFYRWIAATTIGNLGKCEGGTCETFEEWAMRPLSASSELLVRNVTQFCGVLDCIAMGIFVIGVVIFKAWWIPRTVRRHDDAHVTAADYAAFVDGLPRMLKGKDEDGKDLHPQYEALLRKHFMDIMETELGVTDPNALFEITLVREYDGWINKFMIYGEILSQLHNLQVLVKRKEEDEDDKAVRKLDKQIASYQKQIAKMDDGETGMQAQGDLTDEQREVCGAYLMFNKENVKCEMHTLMRSRKLRHKKDKFLFFGKRIRLAHACEPTDLNCNNLDYELWKRWLRKLLMLFIATLILIACATVLVYVKPPKPAYSVAIDGYNTWVFRAAPQSRQANGCWEMCHLSPYSNRICDHKRSELSGRIMQVFTSAEQDIPLTMDRDRQQVVPWQGFLGEVRKSEVTKDCRPGKKFVAPSCTDQAEQDYLGFTFVKPTFPKCLWLHMKNETPADFTMEVFACKTNDRTLPGFPDIPCARLQDVTRDALDHIYPAADLKCQHNVSLEAVTAAVLYGADSSDPTVNCYCSQQSSIEGAGFLMPPYDTPQKKACQTWAEGLAKSLIWASIGAISVTALNAVSRIIFMYMDEWARHLTTTDQAISLMTKLFVVQFINTGLLMLLINWNLRGYAPPLEYINIGLGGYDDFQPAWFTTIGVDIIIGVMIQALSCPISAIFTSFILNPYFIAFFERDLVTKETLGDVWVLPDWDLAMRLAQNLNIFFCVLLYSGSMPILNLIGAAYCLLAYWADKWVLLKGSHAPPAYKTELAERSATMLIFAAMFHLIMSAMMFSNQVLFPSDWSFIHSFALRLFRMTDDKYLKVMQDREVKDEKYLTFAHARLLDLSREGSWPMLLIFCSSVLVGFFYLVYKVLRFLYTMQYGEGAAPEEGETERSAMEHSQISRNSHERNVVFSYKMEANDRFADAYRGLKHVTKTPPDVETTKSTIWSHAEEVQAQLQSGDACGAAKAIVNTIGKCDREIQTKLREVADGAKDICV